MKTDDVPLVVSSELREALLRFRLQRGIHADPVLRGADVAEVEGALGHIVLPADVLAMFAATGRELREVVTWTEDARDANDLFGGYIVIAVEEDWPRSKRWCAEAELRRSARQRRPAGPTSLYCWPSSRKHRPTQTHSLAEFMRGHYLLGSPSRDEQTAIEGLQASFAPRVLAATARPVRTVWHPRFGRGIVLRELKEHPPKLEVDFGDVGRKLVLASYVKDRPPEPLSA